MNPPQPDRERILRRAENAAVAVLCLLALVLLVLRVLTHASNFDESIHIRFAWLLSTGLKPEADYFCQYPALAYICTLPYIKIFPESVYLVLALRGLSVAAFCLIGYLFWRHGRKTVGSGAAGVLPVLLIVAATDNGAFLAEYSIDHFAALTAIGALTLIFRPCRAVGLGAAAAMAVLSVTFTPKYVLPLSFGLLGAAAAALIAPPLPPGESRGEGWRRRGAVVVAGSLGCLAAVLLVVLLYWLANVSFADNFRYAHLLMSKYNLEQQKREFSMAVGAMLATFLARHALLTGLLVAGIACWAIRGRREGIPSRLSGAGPLLGLAAFMIALGKNLCMEQYMTPMLFCAALYAPYCFPNKAGRLLNWLRWSLLAVVGVAVSWQYLGVATEFRETPFNVRGSASTALGARRLFMQPPMLKMLRYCESCLRLIPEHERVVAVWPYHPLFRRDLTWVTNDDVPSFTGFLDVHDRAQAAFAPEAFRAALERNPPAFIAISRLELDYPPGWDAVCREFLRRHRADYVGFDVDSFGNEIVLRKDLVHDRPAAAAHFDRAVELEEQDASGMIDLGDKLVSHGHIQEAIAHYRKALQFNPKSGKAHNNLGILLSDSGHKDEAVEHFRLALEDCPPNKQGWVRLNLADALADTGHAREALEHFRAALALASAHDDKALAGAVLAKIKQWQLDAPGP
jgi:hypothetical protein